MFSLCFWFPIMVLSFALIFTHIAASSTASDDVTNYVTHRVFNIDLLYSCSNFIVKFHEKFSHNDGFNTILRRYLIVAYLFLATCIRKVWSTRGNLWNLLWWSSSVPPKVKNIRFVNIGSNLISLLWDVAQDSGAEVTYDVTYYTEDSEPENATMLMTRHPNVTLDGLLPQTKYAFKAIAARYDVFAVSQ